MNRPKSAQLNYAPGYRGPNFRYGPRTFLAGAALSVAALTLSGCVVGNAEGPTSSPTSTSTPSPEATTPSAENKPFTGTINYAAFENFEEKDELAKDAACAEFFDTNLPDSIRISSGSTGPEVAQWYADRVELVSALNQDQSDPRNQSTAQVIVDCLTAQHEETDAAATALRQELSLQADNPMDGFKLTYVDPNKVTRFSDGVFLADGTVGDAYNAFTLEGYATGFGDLLKQQVFEWRSSEVFPSMRLSTSVSEVRELPSGGKPPIVVDPAFANYPWY